MLANNIELPSNFYGETSLIVAKRGFGKSHTARVIIEEGLEKGHTFVVVDPQDAYLNMESFEYVVPDQIKDIKKFAALVAHTHKNVIIRLKRLSIEAQNDFVSQFLKSFKKNIIRGIQTIVIDEIHKFAPESSAPSAKEEVRGMFQENRSDGLGCIGITQRISRVDKTILSQADNLIFGRVTSFRDCEAVKNYIDNVDDIDTIKKLNKGEFYFYGFDLDEPSVEKVRKSTTKHSGDSPTNLLTEKKDVFDRTAKSVIKFKGQKMDNVNTGNDIVPNVVPSVKGFGNLALLGMKTILGIGISGTVATALGSRFQSPVPYVSSRTLVAGLSTVGMYFAYRMTSRFDTVNDVLKYASAGSAAFTAGSLAWDVLSAFNVRMPNWLAFAVASATGASPMAPAAASDTAEGVDLDTNFR
jgi:hypothetical protein